MSVNEYMEIDAEGLRSITGPMPSVGMQIMQQCIVLYYTLLHYMKLCYTILYHSLLYYTTLNLYSTTLYETVLYYIIPYSTLLYYIKLCHKSTAGGQLISVLLAWSLQARSLGNCMHR